MLMLVWLECTYFPLTLTPWDRDKMAAISQTTFSNAFFYIKMYKCRSIKISFKFVSNAQVLVWLGYTYFLLTHTHVVLSPRSDLIQRLCLGPLATHYLPKEILITDSYCRKWHPCKVLDFHVDIGLILLQLSYPFHQEVKEKHYSSQHGEEPKYAVNGPG